MKSRIGQLKYYFVGLLVICNLALAGYELLYDLPRKKCEAAGNWWSWKYRQCAVPMKIIDMPGFKRSADAASSS